MKFLCDEMLAGLARWLRAAGYDTALADGGMPDRDLVARAAEENRLLMTRDRKILEIRGADQRVLLLCGDGIDTWVRQLSRACPVDWTYRPFSRCLLCNSELVSVGDGDGHALPPGVDGHQGPFMSCPDCRRVYWEGSHVRRMRNRLERFRTL